MNQFAFQSLLADREIPIRCGMEECSEHLRTGRRAPATVIVVSDTSPILSLARIGRLDLLESLYRQVLIPAGVFAEIRS